MAAMTPSPPIDLIIRFSTSAPDILLPIPHPSTTTTLALKQLLRTHLDAANAQSRLRLIHAGKVLPDTVALSKSLNVTLPPRDDDSKSAKAKGKQPVRDVPVVAARVYIHCSLGDGLTASELGDEARQAEEADQALLTHTTINGISDDGPTNTSNVTRDAPRGFDRLLNAGFTAPEIATLRTQFLAIQSHSHTPDTMPTGADLLALEERWLDSSNPASGTDTAAGGGFDDEAGGLEDMLYGNLIGFFWPVGAMGWLMREQGVWSRRKQIAVLSGFLVNLTFGGLRFLA